MKTVKFFYAHTTQDLQVPDDTPVLTSKVDQLTSDRTGLDIVREAMENPIDSPRLCELARGKDDCVIIISDHTRPVPSKDILPNMVRELREGNPDIKITLLVSTGFHRPTTIEELRNKLGDALYEEFKDSIVVHDAHDPSKNVKVGSLPSGPDCIIDKVAINTQLLVSEGFIEPHFFAGFSGGRKSILPGVADAVTVMHEDMLAAARMAKLAYIVNVVIDEDKKTVAAFAGNFETAHRKGCDFISDYVCVKPAYADIVITTNGGYPLDQNAYQSPKGMTAGEATAKEGAVIIMLASCSDGTGGDFFYHIIADEPDIETAYQKFLATPQEKTAPDQWCSQILARIVRKYKVIFVANEDQKDMIEGLKMEYAPSLEAAYKRAREIKGEDASLTCIPNGISVVVRE